MTRKTQATSELQNLDSMLPDLEALYKDIHAHPELSMQETRTAGMAAERLRAAGYDMHVTWLVGVTTLFAQAVFQPAEERGTGAQAMIDDGLFKRFPKPDMVLGQHVMPMSAGTLNSQPTLRPGHPSHSGDRRAGVSRCRASLAVGVRHRPAGN